MAEARAEITRPIGLRLWLSAGWLIALGLTTLLAPVLNSTVGQIRARLVLHALAQPAVTIRVVAALDLRLRSGGQI